MSTPTHWRDYERHPLSARYGDITGRKWQDFKDNLSKRKIRGRSITLAPDHDDGGKLKILDGYQLYRGCLELDIEPKFSVLREGEDPQEFVSEANDHRRHESQDLQEKRADERRDRVVKARVNGEATRTIADREKVSQTTILNDVKTATEQGVQLSPPDGKVTGADGKKRDASKPKILCDRCQRTGEIKDCQACKEARLTARSGPSKAPRGSGKPKPERNGAIIDYKKDFEDAYGKMARIVQEVSNGCGKPEPTPIKECRAHMNALMASFKSAHKILKELAK